MRLVLAYILLYGKLFSFEHLFSAASVMYECASRWGQEVSGLDGLEKMVEYLTTCHNCLLLVDQRFIACHFLLREIIKVTFFILFNQGMPGL